MTHPSSLDLEAFACGETSPRRGAIEEHLEACSACRAFVNHLGVLVAKGPTASETDAMIARALTRAPEAKPDHRSRWWLVATSTVVPLAAAAAVLLLARAAPDKPGDPDPRPDRIEIAPTPTADPDTTFKGGIQLAIVRDRDGQQRRFASALRVRAGDRIRVEVALDRERAILAAVLSDDGSYLELMPLGVRGPGTHFSERSAKVDGSPTHGTLVVGTPEAVARARATRQLDGVASLRIEWEGAY